MKRTYFEVKNIGISDNAIKDVDMKSRVISGYFSRFGNVDHDQDMIVHGAFTKTIKERGQEGTNEIVHLTDHWMSTDNLLGKPKLFELRDGGYFETRVSETQKGNDILTLYRDGVINQHSFGFKTIKSEDKKGYREIQEVKIFEISTVVLGANPNTPFTGFKSLQLEEMEQKLMTLENVFRNGTGYSDGMFQLMEAQIKQLEQEILAKVRNKQTEPERASTQSADDDILSLLAAGSDKLSLTLFNI